MCLGSEVGSHFGRSGTAFELARHRPLRVRLDLDLSTNEQNCWNEANQSFVLLVKWWTVVRSTVEDQLHQEGFFLDETGWFWKVTLKGTSDDDIDCHECDWQCQKSSIQTQRVQTYDINDTSYLQHVYLFPL